MIANQKTTPHGLSFVSFSLDPWSSVWRSRHHVMRLLARSHRVLYLSPPHYVGDVLRDPLGRNGSEPWGLRTVESDLHVWTPPRWLPDSYRFRSLDRLVKGARTALIKRAMRGLGMRQPILYIWHPAFVDAIAQFDESLVVYHVYDEYSAFDQTESQRALLIEQEQRLLRRADVVFASSEEQHARRSDANPNVHLVRNAVDYALFAKARNDDVAVPDDLSCIRRPIVGCVTTQTPFMDLRLLSEIFSARPDLSLVFIGVARGQDDNSDPSLRVLQTLPNVHFIGRRPIEQIPSYLKGCDVCAIPWLLNGVTLASSSPLKLYEYLAAGKPVICKPTPLLLKHLAGFAYFATEATEWSDAIDQATREDSPALVELRQALARDHTWEQRVGFISQQIAAALSRRGRAPATRV